MSPGQSWSDDDAVLAAELMLGLLGGDERDNAELRLRNDTPFAAACDYWSAQFMTLLQDRAEAPPPSVWRHLEGRLPANDFREADRAASLLRWWQAATFVASAAAAILAVIAIGRTPSAPAPRAVVRTAAPQLIAVLTGDNRAGVVTVSFDPGRDLLILAPSGLEVRGHAAELWVIPADKRPRSLGVIPASAPSGRLAPLAPARFVVADATLAISLEPAGGSPTGAPTGPVVVSGKIVSL